MATSAQVQQLYITYFGRPADPSGLAYWTLDEATPLETIANGFATTPEYAADIDGQPIEFVVNSFYVDLFGRNAEPEGLTYWTTEILAGRISTQEVGLQIGNAALANPGNADWAALTAKLEASAQWTATVSESTEAILSYTGQVGIDAGVAYLAPVVSEATIPTQEATDASVAALIQANGGGAANTYELTVFQDIAQGSGTVILNAAGIQQGESTFRFTAQNQTVNGSETNFSGVAGGDVLVDVSTTDEDVLNLTAITDFRIGASGAANATVSNIENINIVAQGAAQTFANGTNTTFTNAQSLTVSGTIAAGNAGFTLAGTGISEFDSSDLTDTNATDALAITADAVASTITTGATDDTVVGSAFADTVSTGAGADVIRSGAGADTVDGGANNDTITGGAGVDVLTGGTGLNTFIWAAGLALNTDRDEITDGKFNDAYQVTVENAGALIAPFTAAVTGDGSSLAGAVGAGTTNAVVANALDITAAGNVVVSSEFATVLQLTGGGGAGIVNGIDGILTAQNAAFDLEEDDGTDFTAGDSMFAVVLNQTTGNYELGYVTIGGAGGQFTAASTLFEVTAADAMSLLQFGQATDFLG